MPLNLRELTYGEYFRVNGTLHTFVEFVDDEEPLVYCQDATNEGRERWLEWQDGAWRELSENADEELELTEC